MMAPGWRSGLRPCRALGLPVAALCWLLLAGPGHVAAQPVPDLFAAGPAAQDAPVEGSTTSEGAASEDLNVEAFLSDQKLDELPCVPQDFLRDAPVGVPGQCAGTRQVDYSLKRACTPAFVVKPHAEPCGCRPDDYMWTFQKSGEQCMQHYSCPGGEEHDVVTDDIHCSWALGQGPACTEDMLETLYQKCDYIRDKATREKISETQAVEVIYYFRSGCDPGAKGSIRAPPSTFIPCDTSCGAGKYLKGNVCHKCTPGTYSLGGVVRYERFVDIDPSIFRTSCTYKTLVPGSNTELQTLNCTQGWYAEDYALEVGQFDYVNEWFPDECSSDSTKDCHNNLQAVLAMEVDLVTTGHVAFNFSVNSEKGRDGLSFYIDTMESPIMGLESYEVVPRMVQFLLTPGRHTLSWVYSKDQHFTQGEDIAVIHSIEISGLALNAFVCTQCPVGFFSNEAAEECTPCAVNTIAPLNGTGVCSPCLDTEFALAMPRVKCLQRQPCNLSRDATRTISPCKADTRQQVESWRFTQPQVCIGGDLLPADKSVPCEPCKPGFEEYVDTVRNLVRCRECPPGSARAADQAACGVCAAGQYAPRMWSLRGFDYHTGRYPPGMGSFCAGACGTSGWRVMADHLDSGRHHGDGAQVFLYLHVMVDSEGSVWFNYSADMSAGPKKRGFFFYIDDNIMDFVQDNDGGALTPDTVKESGPWDLKPGRHKLVWEWTRISEDAPATARDDALIYDIVIKGNKFGYADKCEAIPAGYQRNKDTNGIDKCPAGTFSDGNADACKPCAENMYSEEGSGECLPCGPGTSSAAGSADCFIGAVNDVASFCSFFDTSNAPTSFENVTDIIQYYFYDLTPLNRMSLSLPFGPVKDALAEPGQASSYFISICNRQTDNRTCHDLNGKALNTYACLVRGEEEQLVGHQPAVNLGKTMSLSTLAEYGPGLGNRGVRLSFQGETCPKTGQPRVMNITLVCSPKSGYGTPTHWTAEGKAAIFDPSLKSPRDWVQTGGIPLAIEDRETCFHDLVWYSEIACHECSFTDYDEVRINDCKDNKLYTYRWKQDLACLPTEKAPLPSDIMCQPCTAADFIENIGTCTDANGDRNVTYSWSMPKVCSSELPNAVPMPTNIQAGVCIQTFLFVPSSYLSPKYVFVFALLGVLLVIMLTIFLVAYIKHRRITRFYSKLVESEESATEMAGMDDDTEHMNGNGNHAQH